VNCDQSPTFLTNQCIRYYTNQKVRHPIGQLATWTTGYRYRMWRHLYLAARCRSTLHYRRRKCEYTTFRGVSSLESVEVLHEISRRNRGKRKHAIVIQVASSVKKRSVCETHEITFRVSPVVDRILYFRWLYICSRDARLFFGRASVLRLGTAWRESSR